MVRIPKVAVTTDGLTASSHRTQIHGLWLWHGWISDMDNLMDPRSMLTRFGEPIAKSYRLINANYEAHPHLDALYDCLEDALNDAIAWLGEHPAASQSVIGVEMSTRGGEWRTVRYPVPLDAFLHA